MRETILLAEPSVHGENAPPGGSRRGGEAWRVFESGDELVDWCYRERAEGRSYPVCILDMDLPGTDVLETALRLRAVDPWTEIVFCSSDPGEEIERMRSRLHDGVHLVHKPIAREDLLGFAKTLAVGWDRDARQAERGERFRSVVHSSNDAVVLLDREGGILECNPSARHLLRLDESASACGSLAGLKLVDLGGTRHERGHDPFLDVFETSSPVRNRILGVLDGNGIPRSWFVANATPLGGDEDEGTGPVVLTMHDVTVVRRLHEELRTLEGDPSRNEGSLAEQRLREIRSRILSEALHAAGSCMGATQILSDRLLEGDLDSGMKLLAKALRENQVGLLAFLDDLLDHSRIEAGRLSVIRVGFDLRALMEDVHSQIVAEAASKGLRTNLSFGGDGSPFVLGDPGRFRQILTNLLVNALRSTTAGEVGLTAEIRRIGDTRTEVLLAVSDTSEGSCIDQENAFRPFAWTGTGKPPDGAGIELATARELTRLMGGNMWIECECGEGCVILARFAMDRAVEKFRPALEGEASLERSRVLVADTRVHGREAMLQLVSRFGCSAEGVASIETLRSALRTGGPWDAVVVDRSFVRDDPSGWISAIRSQVGQLPPFVLLSPVGVRGEAGEAFAAGWSGYLTHPLRSRVLQSALVRCRDEAGAGTGNLTRHSIEESIRRGLRILAVDRTAEGRIRATRMFESLGLAGRVVDSGFAALELMHREDFDVVFLEPDFDGLRTAKSLRSGDVGNRCGDVSLVALASPAHGDDEMLMDCGFDGILRTPCTTAEVGDLLRKIQDSIDLGSQVDLH